MSLDVNVKQFKDGTSIGIGDIAAPAQEHLYLHDTIFHQNDQYKSELSSFLLG